MRLTIFVLSGFSMVSRRTAPFPRVRCEVGISRTSYNSWATQWISGDTPGVYTKSVLGSSLSGYRGKSRYCSDVVTPGYQEIVSQGGIANNPFTSLMVEADHGGKGQQSWYTSPFQPRITWSMDVNTLLRNDPRYLFGDVIPAEGELNLSAILSGIDVAYHMKVAKTSALSKVDQNLASGLVGLGELKATLNSLVNPFNAIRQYYQRVWRTRSWRYYVRNRNWGSGKSWGTADRLPTALANEYLALYYGLLPFCRDIESYIDAYVKSGYETPRTTARGSSSDTTEAISVVTGVPTPGLSHYDHKFTRRVNVEVRSGILYEPTPLTWQKVYGVRFSDFFDAAYQLAPWSFFVDYFSNLGKLINALTPRVGVTYLASWSAARVTIYDRAECTGGGVGSNYIWIRPNTEWAERTIKLCIRNPEPVYAHVGLALKTGDWSSYAKIGAVISLLIQGFSKPVNLL